MEFGKTNGILTKKKEFKKIYIQNFEKKKLNGIWGKTKWNFGKTKWNLKQKQNGIWEKKSMDFIGPYTCDHQTESARQKICHVKYPPPPPLSCKPRGNTVI